MEIDMEKNNQEWETTEELKEKIEFLKKQLELANEDAKFWRNKYNSVQERVEDGEKIAELIFPYVGDVASDYYAKEEREDCLKATKEIQNYIKGE